MNDAAGKNGELPTFFGGGLFDVVWREMTILVYPSLALLYLFIVIALFSENIYTN